MRRRDVLQALAGAGATVGLAGCLGSAGAGDPPRGTPDGSPTPTPPPPPGTTPPDDSGPHPVTPTDTSFEVRSRECGVGEDRATVSFDADGVAVDGVVGGRDTCDTARLAGASLRDGTLEVVVEVYRETSDATVACAQCLTDVAYRFAARVPGGGPERVRVVHDAAGGRTTVTVADRP